MSELFGDTIQIISIVVLSKFLQSEVLLFGLVDLDQGVGAGLFEPRGPPLHGLQIVHESGAPPLHQRDVVLGAVLHHGQSDLVVTFVAFVA